MGTLAQAWRNPERQWHLTRAVKAEDVDIHPLDEEVTKAAGRLCAMSSTSDVIHASVVVVARRVDGVTVTSDADDLRRLDPTIALLRC